MKRLLPVLTTALMLVGCERSTSPNRPQPNLQILSLGANSAAPMSRLSVTVTGLDTTANTWVRFKADSGFLVDVPVVPVDPTTLLVTVPPFLSQAGAIGPGVVGIEVVQVSGQTTRLSNLLGGFQIQGLPILPGQGIATVSFLTGALHLARQLPTLISGTRLDTPDVTAALVAQINELAVLDSQIQGIVDNPSSSATLGSVRGTDLTITASDLATVDQLILGMLQAQDVSSSAPATSSGLRRPNPVGVRSQVGCGTQSRLAYSDYLLHGVQTSLPSAINLSDNLFGTVTRCPADGINTFQDAVQGSGATASGALENPGALANVLRKATAALDYFTTVLPAEMIAIDGALKQQSCAGVESIQGFVKKLQGLLADPTNLSAVGEASGLFGDAKKLIEAFTGAPRTSAPCQPVNATGALYVTVFSFPLTFLEQEISSGGTAVAQRTDEAGAPITIGIPAGDGVGSNSAVPVGTYSVTFIPPPNFIVVGSTDPIVGVHVYMGETTSVPFTDSLVCPACSVDRHK